MNGIVRQAVRFRRAALWIAIAAFLGMGCVRAYLVAFLAVWLAISVTLIALAAWMPVREWLQ